MVSLTSPNSPSPSTSTNLRFLRGNSTSAQSTLLTRMSEFGTAYTLLPLTPCRLGMLGTQDVMTSEAAQSASQFGGLSRAFMPGAFCCLDLTEECVDDVTGVIGDVTGGRATIKGGLKSSSSSQKYELTPTAVQKQKIKHRQMKTKQAGTKLCKPCRCATLAKRYICIQNCETICHSRPVSSVFCFIFFFEVSKNSDSSASSYQFTTKYVLKMEQVFFSQLCSFFFLYLIDIQP